MGSEGATFLALRKARKRESKGIKKSRVEDKPSVTKPAEQ